MARPAGNRLRIFTQIFTPPQVTLTSSGDSDAAQVQTTAPFAEAAARAATILAQSLGAPPGGDREMPGQMEVGFALQYIRRNVSCLGRAAEWLSVPTGQEDAAELASALQSLAGMLSAGGFPSSDRSGGAQAPAGDLGRGQTGMYDLPGADGHVSTATVRLSNGLTMPLVGYGAFQMDSSGIRAALDAGYRLIDTAESYRNETEVGTVLHEFLGENSELGREDIWIVSKNSSSRGRTAARANLERQLADLQVDYIDLYYLHSWETDQALRAETWAVMEEYYAAGKIKALGISNHYHPEQVEAILSVAKVKPHVVQNKFCPFAPGYQYDNHSAADPISYFTKLGIAFVSYSTLSGWPLHKSGAISPKDDPHVAAVAKRLQRTPTQVLLRWALQHGAAVIPTSRTHAADNAAVFDFELDEVDMAAISGMSWFFEVPDRNTPQFADVLAVQTAPGSAV